MLSPLVSAQRCVLGDTGADVCCRPVPTSRENGAVQRAPGSQEQGCREDLWQVLSGERASGGDEAAEEAMFILLSYHVVLCMHQNDFAAMQGQRVYVGMRGRICGEVSFESGAAWRARTRR